MQAGAQQGHKPGSGQGLACLSVAGRSAWLDLTGPDKRGAEVSEVSRVGGPGRTWSSIGRSLHFNLIELGDHGGFQDKNDMF